MTAAFGSDPHREEPREHDGPIVRDRRRIDPVTGQVREPQQAAAPDTGDDETAATSDAAGNGDDAGRQEADGRGAAADLEKALSERTADLQRLQAEYVNYKRRVDRDREVVKETATASVLSSLLPVLDDIGRAREHGELVGGFKAVAESFERIISGLGLEPFGVEGDDFDPRVHEALMHSYDDEVDRPVAKAVLQVGYRLGERILRPARVAVVEPAGSSDVPLDPTSLGDDVGSAADQPADAGAADDENNDEGR